MLVTCFLSILLFTDKELKLKLLITVTIHWALANEY